jgi:galactonate dehydratase
MKITKLTTFIVPPRWCFLKVETDQGVTGWGEPVVEGRAHTVAAAVEELSDYLIGKDPRNIEDIWTVLYRGGFYRGGAIHMSALAGIDQALWDIKGKALGVSVSDLLGGQVRDKIRVYSRRQGSRGPWFYRRQNERHRRTAISRQLRKGRPGPGQRGRRA